MGVKNSGNRGGLTKETPLKGRGGWGQGYYHFWQTSPSWEPLVWYCGDFGVHKDKVKKEETGLQLVSTSLWPARSRDGQYEKRSQ